MRRWIGLVVLLGLLGALVHVGRNLFRSGFRLGGAASVTESRWRTEEQWLVDSIVRDLAEMAAYAGHRRFPLPDEVDVVIAQPETPGGPVRLAVTLAPGQRVEHEIALASFIWSPLEYRDLARALVAEAGAPPAPSGTESPPIDAVSALTDLRPKVIEAENQRVSSALAHRFTDPAVHESAALVLGALGIREAAIEYSDIRALLCRMTAHLAFAAALRPDSTPSRDGRVAAAVLLVLAGRGADAAAALDELEAEARGHDAVAAWRAALRLRLTDDPRHQGAGATLIERRELYRARLRCQDPGKALDHVHELLPERLTDRWRLASEVSLSVEGGNVLLYDALELELEEARQVLSSVSGVAVEERDLVSALNEPAGRCLTRDGPRAIARGTWAEALQRHLVSCLWRIDSHLRRRLSLHDQADLQLGEIESRFSRLRLYPMVEARCSSDARRLPRRLDELVTLTVEQPELINAWVWTAYGQLASYQVVARGMPDPGAWFRPALPRGTTFDLPRRRRASLLRGGVEQLRALKAVSPESFDAAEALVDELFGDTGASVEKVWSVEEVAPLFGSRVEYDVRVLHRLSGVVARDPASLRWALARACALEADECHDLGHVLVELGDSDGAERAYQRGFEQGSDRVLASNRGLWLMHRYLDTGRRDRARRVAEELGETGSSAGLYTLARYFERTGSYRRAEIVLKEEMERYGKGPQSADEREESRDGIQREDELIGYYHRMAHERKDGSYEGRFQELAADDFPDGLERAELRSFTGPPTDGVTVLKTYPRADRLGVKAGDVIVALDGFRVRTRRQYFLVRGFSDAAEMSLVVFRHPGYVALKVRSASRLMGCDLRSRRSAGP